MIRKLGLILILLVISACTSAREPATLATTPTGAILTVTPGAMPRPTVSGSSESSTATVTTPALPTQASPIATPPATPKPSGWKTYVNTQWQATLDYPPDWLVREQAAGVAFTSPQGAEILLALVETGGLSPEDYLTEAQLPNTRCAPDTNAHAVAGRVCFDTISFSYTAYLILQPANGAGRLLSLSIHSRESQPVFNTMIASVRLAP
jgi:hypothetical protein